MVPNNVLVLGPPKSGKIRIAQYISGDYGTETIPSESHSGLIYNCDLTTKYFNLKVNILVEEFPDERGIDDLNDVDHFKKWFGEFSSEEFQELRDALDGVVFTVSMDSANSRMVEELLDVFAGIRDLVDEEAFIVVVGSATNEVNDETLDEYEDMVIRNGFEFVNLQKSGTNEYMEKQGKERLLEIFQTHLWSDMDKMNYSEEKIASHRRDKVAGMTQGLLEVEDDEKRIDFERILKKLSIDKEKVQSLKEEERQEYVDRLVEEYLEFL